jgi:hypothetical protein
MTPGARTKLMSALVVLLAGLNAMGQKTLQGTYVDQATTTSTAIPAGTMVAIGNPITVTCTPSFKTGCTLVADMWTTNGAGNTSGNQFELCLLVDGVRAALTAMGIRESRHRTASGSHTVQAFFWSRNGCTVVTRPSTT